MDMVTTTLKIPPDLLYMLDEMARYDDVTTGHLVRSILSKEVSRRRNARPPIRADELLIAPIRARLAQILGTAPDWETLQRRLREHGYELHQAGGGLALYRIPQGQRVCKASELGFSYSKLVTRLLQPFPGHTHTHVFERVMRQHQQELDVIEPFHCTTSPSGHSIV